MVELNLAIGGGADSSTPVVDFSGAFAGEFRTLFGVTAGNNGITVDELTTLSGQNAYSSIIGELYAADADVAAAHTRIARARRCHAADGAGAGEVKG